MNRSAFEKELVRLRQAIQENKVLLRRSKQKVQDLDASIQSSERIIAATRVSQFSRGLFQHAT